MIPFSEYMSEWLYGKNGYYSSMPDVGKKGDFYTSVSTSMFFGGCIANHIIKCIENGNISHNVKVVEIGAHKGYLLADIIQFIYTLRPELIDSLTFAIVEPLENIRKSQVRYFKQSFDEKVHVQIVDSIDKLSHDEVFIVSNELFDAFSCEVIKENQMLYMDEHKPVFGEMDKATREFCIKNSISKGEIVKDLDKFIKNVDNSFAKYIFLTFDYGDMRYRDDFSLRVYKEHQVYPFFELSEFAGDENRIDTFYKKSDITYDVSFLQIKEEFEKVGAKMNFFSTQMSALVDFGLHELLEILQKNVSEGVYRSELEKAKMLILPDYFGERFKAIEFSKN